MLCTSLIGLIDAVMEPTRLAGVKDTPARDYHGASEGDP